MFTNLINEKSKDELRLEVENYFIEKKVPFPDTWKWETDKDGRVFFTESMTNKKRFGKLVCCEICERQICVRLNSSHKNCSIKCNSMVKVNRLKMQCANCHEEIWRVKTKLKNSKSGLFFCNRKCKEEGQMIGGIKEIQPEHYKDGVSAYSERGFRYYGVKCKDCDVKFKPLLVVHHIDGNRDNGDINNLEVVCANHHALRHMVFNETDKVWVLNFSSLTPRNMLKKIEV